MRKIYGQQRGKQHWKTNILENRRSYQILPGPSSTILWRSFCQRFHFGYYFLQHVGKAYLHACIFQQTLINWQDKKHRSIPTLFTFLFCSLSSLPISLFCQKSARLTGFKATFNTIRITFYLKVLTVDVRISLAGHVLQTRAAHPVQSMSFIFKWSNDWNSLGILAADGRTRNVFFVGIAIWLVE